MKVEFDLLEHVVVNVNEPARITEQWREVMHECSKRRLGEVERANIALNVVDYVTSSDLPYRLLITRAPQAIALLRRHQPIFSQKCKIECFTSPFTESRGARGAVYTTIRGGKKLPEQCSYNVDYVVKRFCNGQLSNKLCEYPTMWDALEAGHQITSLDGILYWGVKRVAADIERKKRTDPTCAIEMIRVTVFDSFTRTIRKTNSYRYVK